MYSTNNKLWNSCAFFQSYAKLFACCLQCIVLFAFCTAYVGRADGFPYEDQIEELLIVIVSFSVFPTSNIFNFFINFNFF